MLESLKTKSVMLRPSDTENEKIVCMLSEGALDGDDALNQSRLEAYSHSKVPISNSDFDGGDKDPDGASPKYAYCAFFSFLQERSYTSTSGDARQGLVEHVWCSSELLAAAREGEPLKLLEQSPGPVFGLCIE
ncbi:hypothetical protein CXB51_034373 [Gossypium anomalum]|uniref:Uncharacterized protein n=1 Tax=Gossypium anomalum TaxID=47600 RepID=A0A8J6CJL6_9ROSI|nr:hypothetical protein CXB51_034373 [Gossypium anomalum]